MYFRRPAKRISKLNARRMPVAYTVMRCEAGLEREPPLILVVPGCIAFSKYGPGNALAGAILKCRALRFPPIAEGRCPAAPEPPTQRSFGERPLLAQMSAIREQSGYRRHRIAMMPGNGSATGCSNVQVRAFTHPRVHKVNIKFPDGSEDACCQACSNPRPQCPVVSNKHQGSEETFELL